MNDRIAELCERWQFTGAETLTTPTAILTFGTHANRLYSTEAAVLERIQHLADGRDLDRERIRDWAFAGAVLSLIWCVEDHFPIHSNNPALCLARALQR